MINILDGGEEETVKRRWIIGAGDSNFTSHLHLLVISRPSLTDIVVMYTQDTPALD